MNPTLTNEIKRHAVIVALKANHGDLEIAHFLRVARSFVHKIHKELEKENNNVMSVSKHKKTFHMFRFNENTQIVFSHPKESDTQSFYADFSIYPPPRAAPQHIKLSRQLMKTEITQWGQLQKSCMCLKRQSEGVFMKTFNTNPMWRWEVNLFLKNQKKTA